jgi:hypothetical protein
MLQTTITLFNTGGGCFLAICTHIHAFYYTTDLLM